MGKFSLSHVILYSSYLIVIDYIYTVRFLKFDALIYSFHLEKKKKSKLPNSIDSRIAKLYYHKDTTNFDIYYTNNKIIFNSMGLDS